MLIEIAAFVLIGLLGSAAIWLLVYIIRKLFKVISVVIVGFIIFIGIAFFFAANFGTDESTHQNENQLVTGDSSDNENIITEDDEPDEQTGNDKDYVYNSIRWSANTSKRYSINYKIAKADLDEAINNRSTYIGNTWGEIYLNLFLHDEEKLSDVYKKYESMRKNQNAIDFARFVVSSVQELPYTWVLAENCSDAPNYAEIKNSGNECLGNVKNYAVQSPVEFMANLKGDCDTKALALFTILRKFNYDVCIMVSAQYQHAVMGINIPASGKYLDYMGKRYYAWETTTYGYDIGQMAPEYSNMAFWEVVLYD